MTRDPSHRPAEQADDSAAMQPLRGLRVIELHAIGPVPYAGQILRGLGAQVERISPPSDPGLGVDLPAEFDLLNLGKTRMAIDLKSPTGIEAALSRIGQADVLIEGFRPGVLERLGLEPRGLLERNPRLVIGRLSGWGTRGALADRAGHDINYLALAGVLEAVGPADSPVPPLNLVADFGGGAMHLLLGVLSLLVRRSIDGQGGVVETSILAGTVGLTPMFYGMLAAGVWKLDRAENLLDGGAPFYRVYGCADGRFVAVGALEPKFYRNLLRLLALDDTIDATRQYDRTHWPETAQAIGRRLAERPRDEWALRAQGVDACLSPVLNFLEASTHPHNLSMGLFASDPFPMPAQTLRFAGQER